MEGKRNLIPGERIEKLIYLIRGQKVILDRDLAALYGVQTKQLKRAVRRNINRFEEKAEVVANCDHLSTLKYSRVLPHAFTEHGAIMAASVLNTLRAIEVSIFVVRAFVKLREMLGTHKELERKLIALEKKCDEQFKVVFEAIRALMSPPEKPRKKIGFEVKESTAAYRKQAKKKAT